jgi:short-subunit dehydrogenase
VLVDIDGPAAHALAAALESAHGVQTLVLALDLTDPASYRAIELAGRQRRLGLVVNNAGISSLGPFLSLSLGEQLAAVDLNVRASLALSHLLAEPMVSRGRGALVFISSNAGLLHTPLIANYAATKAYLIALGEALWQEFRPTGVHVLTVVPGLTRTPAIQRQGIDPAATRGALVLDASQVAERTLSNLHRGPLLFPNRLDGLSAWVTSWMPRTLRLRIVQAQVQAMFPRTRPKA